MILIKSCQFCRSSKGDHVIDNRDCVTAIANAVDWANQNQHLIIHDAITTGKVHAGLAPFLYSPDRSEDYSLWCWPQHGLQNRDDVGFWIDVAEGIGIVPKDRFKPENIYTDEFNPFLTS